MAYTTRAEIDKRRVALKHPVRIEKKLISTFLKETDVDSKKKEEKTHLQGHTSKSKSFHPHLLYR